MGVLELALPFTIFQRVNPYMSLHHHARDCKSTRIQCAGELIAISEPQGRKGKYAKAMALEQVLTASPAVEFKLSDFDLYPYVSIGLAGKCDEVVYEGIVRKLDSPLKGMRVVLRQLAGPRARRWGQRALEVISKLLWSQDLYCSYTTKIYGYILSSGIGEPMSLTLIHGFHGSYSLHQWFLCDDWVPSLEQRLALNEEATRRIGDDTTGGAGVSRQLRIIRTLMRDILIGVNYLHSRGLAHTELRLKNVHVSAADRHVKVGILGNAADFPDADQPSKKLSTRQQMIAYDIRCVGLMLVRMALRELMDPAIFGRFKEFLTKGHHPAGLREFMLSLLDKASPAGSTGLQVLDRDGGAGWHLLSLMLAPKPEDRISCKDALRHPFLCGPRWRVEFSIDMARWSLGSTAIRIIEEYIYMDIQRGRLTQLIDDLERMNPNNSQEKWDKLLHGKWRLLYHTGRQIGSTLRQAIPAVLIGDVLQSFNISDDGRISTSVNVNFTAILNKGNWSHDKSGLRGALVINAPNVFLAPGKRFYDVENLEPSDTKQLETENVRQESVSRKRKGISYHLPKVAPGSLPVMKLQIEDVDISLSLGTYSHHEDPSLPQKILREVRLQISEDVFDIARLVCGTYIDSKLLILRGVSGAAHIYIKSPMR